MMYVLMLCCVIFSARARLWYVIVEDAFLEGMIDTMRSDYGGVGMQLPSKYATLSTCFVVYRHRK